MWLNNFLVFTDSIRWFFVCLFSVCFVFLFPYTSSHTHLFQAPRPTPLPMKSLRTPIAIAYLLNSQVTLKDYQDCKSLLYIVLFDLLIFHFTLVYLHRCLLLFIFLIFWIIVVVLKTTSNKIKWFIYIVCVKHDKFPEGMSVVAQLWKLNESHCRHDSKAKGISDSYDVPLSTNSSGC